MSEALTDFLKREFTPNLQARRNKIGDLVVGYNRPAKGYHEQVDLETAETWLEQDIQKAKKEVAKYGLDKYEPVIALAFYIGRRRWSEARPVFELFKNGEWTKGALTMTNSKWMKSNPSFGSFIGSRLIQKARAISGR